MQVEALQSQKFDHERYEREMEREARKREQYVLATARRAEVQLEVESKNLQVSLRREEFKLELESKERITMAQIAAASVAAEQQANMMALMLQAMRREGKENEK